MPAFDKTTPTISRTFSGIDFIVPAPFTEGHSLTVNEAKFFNSTLASVIGNAYSGDVRRAEASGKDTSIWNHQELFNKKFAEYELGVSNRGGEGTGTKSDPLARTIAFLASEDMKAKAAARGIKVGVLQRAKSADGTTSKWAELVASNLERNREAFTEQAKAILANNAPEPGEDDDLFAGITEAAEGEVQAAAE